MELVYGDLRVADSPLVSHQAAVFDLACALNEHVRDRELGSVWVSPLDVILDVGRSLVIQPDLFFISTARREIISDKIFGAPDLVVEVLSPHPRIGLLDERLRWFAEYDVRECWLLHQSERRLEIVGFAERSISTRNSFGAASPIRSAVLPAFDQTLNSVLRF
jgi:Uma2 family endonuclease